MSAPGMSTLAIVIAAWIGASLITFLAWCAWIEWHIRREDRRIAEAYDRLAGR